MSANLKSSPKKKLKPKTERVFAIKLATVLLVQSKLLPPAALGIKDIKDNQ